ncbi:hypothetical protein NX059_003632 [Plenodomus lindquistii]|nr:hypothetical protein NX059_003632 [Plenodomus lindquistii]
MSGIAPIVVKATEYNGTADALTTTFASEAYLAYTRSVIEQNAKASPLVQTPAKNTLESSAFLRLPGETRNKIYSRVFDNLIFAAYPTKERKLAARAYEGDLHGAWNRPCEINSHFTGERPRTHSLALLSVCRQLYHKTKILPFKLGMFCIAIAPMMQILKDHLICEQHGAIATLHM